MLAVCVEVFGLGLTFLASTALLDFAGIMLGIFGSPYKVIGEAQPRYRPCIPLSKDYLFTLYHEPKPIRS